MTSVNPPTITLFNGINYNSKFFLSQTGYITFEFLDTNYLKKVGTAISNAFTTFNKDTTFKGKIITQTDGQVSIGNGTSTTGISSVSIGYNAGGGNYSVCIGRGCNTNNGASNICLGFASGQSSNGGNIVALGHQTASGANGANSVKDGVIAIGSAAAYQQAGSNAVLIGLGAGGANLTANNSAIGIGYYAGYSIHHPNSIILNATGADLPSAGANRCHIAPIRSGGTGNVLVYDAGTKEVQVGGNASLGSLTVNGNLAFDTANTRDIGTNSIPVNGVYCNGLIQPSSTNSLTFTANGAERMRITKDGVVGIGTNGPIGNFEVSSSSLGTTFNLSSTAYSYLPATDENVVIMRLHNDRFQTNKYAEIKAMVRGGLNLFMPSIVFSTGSNFGAGNIVQRMIITESGNIGINNGSPAERLDIVGNAKITGNILVDADNSRSIASSSNALANVYAHTGSFKAITVHSATAGNIGTSAKPFNTLFVSTIGSSTTPVSTINCNIWETTTGNNLRCGNNLILSGLETLPSPPLYNLSCGENILMDSTLYDVGCKQKYDATNAELVISTTTSNTERVRIGANGLKTAVNILPTITNTNNIGSSSLKFNTIYTNTILNPTSNLLLGATSTNTVVISTTGMSIGSGGAPTEALNITGNQKISGNILPNSSGVPNIGTSNTDKFNAGWFNTVYGNGVVLTSDRRLKENITPIEDGLKTVMKMKPVEYKFIDGIRIHTGFIADEMKQLYEDKDWSCFVEHDDEIKTQGLQYTEVIALNTKAIQQLNYKIEDQNSLINQQNNKFEDQNSLINQQNNKIEDQNSLINQQNETIQQLNNKIEDQNSLINQQNNKIEDQNSLINQQNETIQQLKNIVLDLANRIISLENNNLNHNNG
jgi:hypothetical protein